MTPQRQKALEGAWGDMISTIDGADLVALDRISIELDKCKLEQERLFTEGRALLIRAYEQQLDDEAKQLPVAVPALPTSDLATSLEE